MVRVLLTKKIQFKEEKFKIRCLWTQLNFIEGLIEFMEGFIARKLIFKSMSHVIKKSVRRRLAIFFVVALFASLESPPSI